MTREQKNEAYEVFQLNKNVKLPKCEVVTALHHETGEERNIYKFEYEVLQDFIVECGGIKKAIILCTVKMKHSQNKIEETYKKGKPVGGIIFSRKKWQAMRSRLFNMVNIAWAIAQAYDNPLEFTVDLEDATTIMDDISEYYEKYRDTSKNCDSFNIH